jgi:hypothetical protein
MEELMMAKTIKFNLICDDKPVRTIEDLQNNFSIEDVLEYYNNKLLHRWLEVRGYSDELGKISAITSEKPLEIIKELIIIFNVASNEKKIEEAVYMLEYLDERKELCDIYSKNDFKTKSLIDDYQTGYKQLVDGILENPEDVARIKANIAEMVTNYKWVMNLNHRELFWTLNDKSVLAVMCLLMNENLREYYVPIESKTEDGVVTKDIDTNADKRNIFNAISRLIKTSDFSTKLGDNLITFTGITDGYWKDLESKGKKFMIISMGAGDFVRSAGVSGGDLSNVDVTDKFVIVDGIDYKSNSSTRQLLYMEV